MNLEHANMIDTERIKGEMYKYSSQVIATKIATTHKHQSTGSNVNDTTINYQELDENSSSSSNMTTNRTSSSNQRQRLPMLVDVPEQSAKVKNKTTK
jgi:hypothetical protein